MFCISLLQSIQDTTNQISFQSLWGLWAIVAAGCALGFICMLLARRGQGRSRDAKNNKRKRSWKGRIISKLFPTQRFHPTMMAVIERNTQSACDEEQAEDSIAASVVEHDGKIKKLDSASRMSNLQDQRNMFGDQLVWEADNGTLSRKLSRAES